MEDADDNGDDLVLAGILCLLMQSPRQCLPRLRASICDMTNDADAYHEFRFTRADFLRLLPLLQLPSRFVTAHRFTSTAEEALLLVLRRLAAPNRWHDVWWREFFNRSPAELCEIFLHAISLLHARWRRKIWCWEDVFAPVNARAFAARSAARMGYPAALYLLYIDGSVVYIQRPGDNAEQRAM